MARQPEEVPAAGSGARAGAWPGAGPADRPVQTANCGLQSASAREPLREERVAQWPLMAYLRDAQRRQFISIDTYPLLLSPCARQTRDKCPRRACWRRLFFLPSLSLFFNDLHQPQLTMASVVQAGGRASSTSRPTGPTTIYLSRNEQQNQCWYQCQCPC